MSIEEFITMITESGALRYEVGHGNSEIGSQFNLSMMTHVDEINTNKHLQMFYYEFLEAVARVAQKIKIFPNIDKYQNKTDKKKSPTKDAVSPKSAAIREVEDSEDSSSDEKEDDKSKTKEEESKFGKTYEMEKEEKSHIINVEDQPLNVKLEIFIKLCEFSCLKNRNFYEFYED